MKYEVGQVLIFKVLGLPPFSIETWLQAKLKLEEGQKYRYMYIYICIYIYILCENRKQLHI